MAAWASERLHDIDEISDGRVPWRPVRHHFGIASFGINAFTGREAGDRIINEHAETEEGNEEIYLVHSGRARFELDGETLDAPAGTLVYVSPEVKRTAFAEEQNTTLVAVGGVPGKAYEANGWEIWAPLGLLYQAGEHEQVAERLGAALVDDPPYPLLHYNAACVYSLTGRTEEAMKHLRRAVELSPDTSRKYAENDPDLEAIRGEPAFAELIG
jgi:tetratricopeptide (TPR) repeat protein